MQKQKKNNNFKLRTYINFFINTKVFEPHMKEIPHMKQPIKTSIFDNNNLFVIEIILEYESFSTIRRI